jgi:carboxymethylenebutenolidase
VIGLGVGGRYALRLAQRGSADAVVAYHALLGEDEGGVIPCPVLLHRAEDTLWAQGVDVDAFVSRLKEHGTPVTQHSYAGTKAGFANATVQQLVDKNAAALAFARSTYFLQAQLLD